MPGHRAKCTTKGENHMNDSELDHAELNSLSVDDIVIRAGRVML
jgi:hypothetical protein